MAAVGQMQVVVVPEPLPVIYYESHITIEPVFDERLELAREIARNWGFRIAELLMQKRREETAERSQYDTFATGRGPIYGALKEKMLGCAFELANRGFAVWRIKIEAVLYDERVR